jgi:hypothetical protein
MLQERRENKKRLFENTNSEMMQILDYIQPAYKVVANNPYFENGYERFYGDVTFSLEPYIMCNNQYILYHLFHLFLHLIL